MPPTTHRATLENGPSVVGGQLVWTSASGITTADPQSYGGCPRRWWYEKVGGKESPETDAMRGGTVLHTELENRLRLGTPLQTPLALAGGIFVPQPGSGLAIERPIHFKTRDGVSIFGHVDLYNFRQEYIDPEGTLQRDPSWSFEVKDWKTTSDFQYAKSERELAENIQLVTYAEAGFRFAPDMEHARLTHVYFRTKGRPDSKLVTIRRSREEISLRWEYAESVTRLMADVAREPTAETVPGNRKACDAYRGCPHRSSCSTYRRNSLDALYNKVAEDFKETPVGLLTNGSIMQPPQPQPDTRAQLAAEEAAMRAQAAQQQQMMPQAPSAASTAELANACQRLNEYGFGFPSLAGNAAQAYAAHGGQRVPPGYVYQGIMAPPGAKRSLHSIQLTEVGHIFQLEGELAAERGPVVPPVQQYTFAHGAQGVVQMTQQAIQNMPQAAQPSNNANFGILPPGAPESIPALAMQHAARPEPDMHGSLGYDKLPAAPFVDPAPTQVVKTRGRPKKEKGLDAAPEATAAVAAQPPPTSAPATQVPPVATSSLPEAPTFAEESCCVLINARFADKSTRSLAGYVDYINAELSKRYSVTSDGKPGIQDVRCAPKDSPLAFGGWKGAVREVVKADPPPADSYHLDTFLDELNEAVADALRTVASSKGWLYVRGTR